MKFKFCGNIDCPDWLITEITYLTKISSVKLRILCNQISNLIISRGQKFNDIKKVLEEMKFSEREAEIIISVLEFILKNSAKFDVDDLALNQELLQLGLSQENADSISKVFKNQKVKLRNNLKENIFGFNKIENVNSKISYVLADSIDNQFDCVNEKDNEDLNEDNYQIRNLDKIKVDTVFDLGNGKTYEIGMDKETLGNLIKDLEKYSQMIKSYKEQE
jgi:hypothetical protein